MTEVVLERGPDQPEDEHVHPQVQDVSVQERGGDQAPPLPFGDERPEEHAVLEDPALVRSDAGAQHELKMNTPTLIPIRTKVTNGPWADSDAVARRAVRFGAATFPPVLA